MKYLLLFGLLGIIWWLYFKQRRPPETKASASHDPVPEKMVTCAFCAVHLPESEGVIDGGKIYCCEAHRVADLSGKS